MQKCYKNSNGVYDKPGREKFFRGREKVQDMNSDSEEDILVDDWLTSKQDFLDTSDEELNDDLLRSDDENETMSSSKPKHQAIALPHVVCETSHPAKDQAICPKEEHTEVDHGEVLDIEINAPSGDEFQEPGDYGVHQQASVKVDVKDDVKLVSSLHKESKKGVSEFRAGLSLQPTSHHLIPSSRGQPDPEEPRIRPCRSPEPAFPGQHMFDQQHCASVLDTNPLLAGPAPMGSIQPGGNESDPWRPSPALQEPSDLSKPGTPHRGHCSLQKHPSAPSGCRFNAPSGQSQVTQKPAVLVRAVARMVQNAKPMAVARGMPITARQPACAKSTITAKTPPAPGTVGRNVGQKVKVEPQTPRATQKHPAKPLNMTNDKEREEYILYMQKLEEQMHLRRQVIKHKERMRSLRAANKRRLRLEHFQTDLSTAHCWNNNQNQQKPPCFLSSYPTNAMPQQHFYNPHDCLVLQCHPQLHPRPPQQQMYQILVPAFQPPCHQALSAQGTPAEVQYNQACHSGTGRVVLQKMEQFADHMSLQYSIDEARFAGLQDVQPGRKRMIEQRISDGPVPAKSKVVQYFTTSSRIGSSSSDFKPAMSEEAKSVTETNRRTVTLIQESSPLSFLQHGLKLTCPIQNKVAISGNEHSAFIPLGSGLKTQSVTAQTSFIVRLNH
ncbi:uncharacterized protein rbm33b isoform X6 [Danio rerio]|uniref:Uncharacterized protein rbm33b isoform X6 n=1 Tax=Danio rerio TaxID=7955 RepID=A0AB32TA34_DANRE